MFSTTSCSRFISHGTSMLERLRYISGERFTLFSVVRYFSARGGTTLSEHVSHPLSIPGVTWSRKSHALSSWREFSDSRSSGVNFLLPTDIYIGGPLAFYSPPTAFRLQSSKKRATPFVAFLFANPRCKTMHVQPARTGKPGCRRQAGARTRPLHVAWIGGGCRPKG